MLISFVDVQSKAKNEIREEAAGESYVTYEIGE